MIVNSRTSFKNLSDKNISNEGMAESYYCEALLLSKIDIENSVSLTPRKTVNSHDIGLIINAFGSSSTFLEKSLSNNIDDNLFFFDTKPLLLIKNAMKQFRKLDSSKGNLGLTKSQILYT